MHDVPFMDGPHVSPAMDGDSQPCSRVARDSGEKSWKIFSPLDVDWVGLDFRSADWSIQWPMVTLRARAHARRACEPAGQASTILGKPKNPKFSLILGHFQA